MCNMTLTIGSASEIWFQRGDEDARREAVAWLASPTKAIPPLFTKIARSLKIPTVHAIALGRLIDDQQTAEYLEMSPTFEDLPLAALNLFFRAKALYETRLHCKNSAGAADRKAMHGQNTKNGYKHGLIAEIGDYFAAHIAYYMAVQGWEAVREVRRTTGWSLEKLKGLLIAAINHINWLQRRIGRRLLRTLDKTLNRGAHFFSTVFAYAARKEAAAKLDADILVEDADDLGNGDGDGDYDDDDAGKKTARVRALAMLANAKRHARNQRYIEILDAIESAKLVNALSKRGEGDDTDVAEKMAMFLSAAWELSERTGRFAARNGTHPPICDAPPTIVVRQLIGLALGRWRWADTEERPKAWRDITVQDDRGKEKLKKLIRPISPIKTRSQGGGRVIVVGPDSEIMEYFFGVEKIPPREHIRFFISRSNGEETITCQRLVHHQRGFDTVPLFDDTECESSSNADDTATSDLRLDAANYQQVARELGIAPELLTAARFGDERALAIIANAGRDMDDDARDRLMDLLKAS